MAKKLLKMDLAGIGTRLKDIRKKLNLRQKEFADVLNTTMVTLSDIETGKKRPGSDILFILSDVYKVNLDFLLHGQGHMFRLGAEAKGVLVDENVFGDYTKDVREMLWYMQHSMLARSAFITLTKEYIYRNEEILKKDIKLQEEKNYKEKSNE